MNSTNSSGNSFTTPHSSPEATEADLRSLEYALGNFRHYLQDTVQTFDTFNEHFLLFSSQDDNVLERLNQTADALSEQVSDHTTHTCHTDATLQQPSSQLDDHREVRTFHPTYPKRRVTSTSLEGSDQFFNSSLGSDTLFGSPNTSFLGFESTAGISGLPFYTQLNSQLTTMAGDEEATQTHPITEDDEPSEGWKRFQKYAKITLESLQAELKLLTKQLQDPSVNQSVAQINTHVFKTNRSRTKLASLEDELKGAMFEESYPQDQAKQIKKDIVTLYFEIDTQQAVIEDSLERAREEAREKDAVAAALRQVANTPTVDLPKFDGKTIEYKAFKTNFQFVIQKVNGPKELWATHLVNSLLGPVKQYIGSENKWFNKYEDLWEMLDSKYDNDWTLYYETISAFFYNVLQSEEPEPFKNFFYAQLDNISSIVALDLTVGELLTTYLIESFPTFYKTQMKEALRALQPNKRKATFTAEEARKVFNNTIGATLDEATIQNKLQPAFLSHYNHATEEESEDEAEDEITQNHAPLLQSLPQQHPHCQGKISGHQQRIQQPNAMSQHQVGSYSQPMPHCSLCNGQDFPHPTHNCHLFPTPQEKRDQLTQLERCSDCTREWHSHWQCPSYLSCTFHPGETHYTWLCPGHAATGPL